MRNTKFFPKFLGATVLLSMMVLGCGKKNNDDEDAAQSTTTSGAAGTTNTDKVNGAYAVVKTVDSAMSSSGSTAPGTLIIPPTSLHLASYMGKNKICSAHGVPVKDGLSKAVGDELGGNDQLDLSDTTYASKLFYCLASMETDSPETIRGSLAQFKSILCSLEKALGKEIEYTEAGNDMMAGATSLKVALGSDCWPQGTPDGMTEVVMDKVLATKMADASGFQYMLQFGGTDVGSYNLAFFNADGRIGFKKWDDGKDDGAGSYTEIVLDSTAGVVLLNMVDDREGAGGADSAYRRTVRMKLKGEFDTESLAFKSIAALQGLYFNSGDYASNKLQFTGTTINGDKDKGFYAHSVGGVAGTSVTDRFKGCTGLKSDCTATGLLIDATNSKTFFDSREDWKKEKTDGLPLCDNGKDIDFAGVMSTGKFGKCE